MALLDDKWLGFKVMAIAFAGAMVGEGLTSLTSYETLGRALTGIGILLFFGGVVLHLVSVGQAVSKKAKEKNNPLPPDTDI